MSDLVYKNLKQGVNFLIAYLFFHYTNSHCK